jgi:hypothetical protein
MPAPFPEKAGLGFDIEEPGRQSISDDSSTLEISTPTHGSKGTFLMYGDESSILPASFKEPVMPIATAFQNGSADTSPASRQPDDSEGSDSDGEFYA